MPAIGLLTAGGDCPGLNAVIRGVVTRAATEGAVIGFRNGWQGLAEDDSVALDRDAVRGILARGGTILGTSRFDPFVHGGGPEGSLRVAASHGLDALIVVGGDGTLRTAHGLEQAGLPIVGVPKTIDNDIPGTDVTFGFDTAVQIATDAIDRLTTTAEAHNRVMLVEVMGRTRGWIAIQAGIAAGADVILIPEFPMPLSEAADIITRRHRSGRSYSIVVVAEGIPPPSPQTLPEDEFGFPRLGGVAYSVAPILEELTGYETRVTVLGHLQRGGGPTARDRILASRLGVGAAELAVSGEHNVMLAIKGSRLEPVPLEEAAGPPRSVPRELWDVARRFFG